MLNEELLSYRDYQNPYGYYKKKGRQHFKIQEPRALFKPQQTGTTPVLGNARKVFSTQSGLPAETSVYRRYRNMVTVTMVVSNVYAYTDA